MTEPPTDPYARLVGLIGAPEVDVPIGLVELETTRAMLARCPGAGGLHPIGLGQRAGLLMRELDHRVGAALVAVDGAPDEARVPVTSDELELMHDVLGAIDASLHGHHPPPEQYVALLVTLDRRRGGEQYRQADPGE